MSDKVFCVAFRVAQGAVGMMAVAAIAVVWQLRGLLHHSDHRPAPPPLWFDNGGAPNGAAALIVERGGFVFDGMAVRRLPASSPASGAGRLGVIASRGVPAGTKILTVKPAAMLSIDTAHSSEVGAQLATSDLELLDQLLVFTLLEAANPTSTFSPMLEGFPAIGPQPYNWPAARIDAVVRSPAFGNIYESSEEFVQEVDEMNTRLELRFNMSLSQLSTAMPVDFPAAILTLERYKWAFSMKNSRSFECHRHVVNIGKVAVDCFIPMADLFLDDASDELDNAHINVRAFSGVDAAAPGELPSLHFVSSRSIRAGEQLLTVVGMGSTGEWLWGHGFVAGVE